MVFVHLHIDEAKDTKKKGCDEYYCITMMCGIPRRERARIPHRHSHETAEHACFDTGNTKLTGQRREGGAEECG